MATLDLPRTVQCVTDSEGRRVAVLLDIRAWDSLLDWIENSTDVRVAVKALTELSAGSARDAGWASWAEVREDWG